MNLNPKFDKLLTIPEVSEYLKVSKSKIYYLASTRQIPIIKIGRNVRVAENDLIKWLEQQKISSDSTV